MLKLHNSVPSSTTIADYSKPFHCVDHLLLFEKLLKLFLKSNVIVWLMNFVLSRPRQLVSV